MVNKLAYSMQNFNIAQRKGGDVRGLGLADGHGHGGVETTLMSKGAL